MDFIRRARPPRSCYTWILQSILTFKYWHFWPVYFPFSTVNWKMKHLAMFQARDPYVFPCWAATDTLQHFEYPVESWQCPKPLVRLGESAYLIYTSPQNSSWTQPDQPPLTQRRQHEGCPGPWAVLAAMHLAYTDGWDTRRGPGLSQHSRIHGQDPPASRHFSSSE